MGLYFAAQHMNVTQHHDGDHLDRVKRSRSPRQRNNEPDVGTNKLLAR